MGILVKATKNTVIELDGQSFTIRGNLFDLDRMMNAIKDKMREIEYSHELVQPSDTFTVYVPPPL